MAVENLPDDWTFAVFVAAVMVLFVQCWQTLIELQVTAPENDLVAVEVLEVAVNVDAANDYYCYYLDQALPQIRAVLNYL